MEPRPIWRGSFHHLTLCFNGTASDGDTRPQATHLYRKIRPSSVGREQGSAWPKGLKDTISNPLPSRWIGRRYCKPSAPWEFEDRLRRRPSQENASPTLLVLAELCARTIVRAWIGSRSRWFHMGFSYPEGNFEGNQLLGDSMSLSPLHQTQTTKLHVRIGTSFHRSFPRLRCSLE